MSAACSAVETLDREFLTFRAKLIDLAAALDRVDRAGVMPDENTRWKLLQRGMEFLASGTGNRAEQMQMLFSLPYDPGWRTESSS